MTIDSKYQTDHRIQYTADIESKVVIFNEIAYITIGFSTVAK